MYYKQLSIEERNIIDFLFHVEKNNMTQIAEKLNRNKSTISRELKRNVDQGKYSSELANLKYKRRQKNKYLFRLDKYKEFIDIFFKHYDKRYMEIKATWHYIFKNFNNIQFISWRQIYNWIKKRVWKIRKSQLLRTGYQKGRKKRVFSKFKDKYVIPIWARPKYIDLRLETGHFELDLVIGKRANGFQNVVTLTERVSRKNFFYKIPTKNPWLLNKILNQMIKDNNLNIKSITIDNGLEFEKLAILAHQKNFLIYLCEPYVSNQRGSNEHANGLLRRFYKKGFDFSTISDQELSHIQDLINNMPREMFNWNSSEQIYNKLIKKFD